MWGRENLPHTFNYIRMGERENKEELLNDFTLKLQRILDREGKPQDDATMHKNQDAALITSIDMLENKERVYFDRLVHLLKTALLINSRDGAQALFGEMKQWISEIQQEKKSLRTNPDGTEKQENEDDRNKRMFYSFLSNKMIGVSSLFDTLLMEDVFDTSFLEEIQETTRKVYESLQ